MTLGGSRNLGEQGCRNQVFGLKKVEKKHEAVA